jgi:hypothetical protein
MFQRTASSCIFHPKVGGLTPIHLKYRSEQLQIAAGLLKSTPINWRPETSPNQGGDRGTKRRRVSGVAAIGGQAIRTPLGVIEKIRGQQTSAEL